MMKPEEVTEEWLIKAVADDVVWVRWDYLSMMYYSDDEDVVRLLERIWQLKNSMDENGVVFKA